MKIYIYCLKSPEGEIRYIGKTGNIINRFNNHLSHSKTLNTRIGRWIKSLLTNNQKPSIHIIEECNENNWQDKEIYWITYYKSRLPNLINHQKGGNQPIPIKKPIQKYTKISNGKLVVKRSLNNKVYYLGIFDNEELAVKAYDSFIKIKSVYNKGIKMLKNGVLVKEFKSATECANEINTSVTNISRCCKGKAKTHKGYTFEYL
jgi:predicted GIY-YIG superfamily endonuclease